MADVRVNGVRLYYEEHGVGPPIICIHGSSSSARMWSGASVEGLASLGRVILYDRRGCARSERPQPFETSVAQQGQDAAGLLEALDAMPAIVIGRSYGGEVAIELALRRPDLVRALVLLEGFPRSLDPEVMAWAASVDETIEDAAAVDMSGVAEAFLRRVLGDETWEAFPAGIQAMFRDNGPAIVAEARGAWLEASEAELGSVRTPTLLVAAEDSPAAFRRGASRTAEILPNATLALVGGGHLIDPGGPEVLRFVKGILAA